MNRPVRFGPFEFDGAAQELRKHDIPLKVAGQPLQVLAMLLERPGEVVTREELRARLWADDTFVGFDHSLNAAVNKLRFALGDSADRPTYVRTLPRRGYVFVGTIEPETRVAHPVQPGGHGRAVAGRRGWAALAVLLVAALVLGGTLWRSRPVGPATASAADRIMLVVLPFEMLPADPEQEYFAEGLTDEMIAALGRLDPVRLGVIARTSAASYRGSRPRVRQIADDLGVDYIVEGSVRRDGARLRVTAQLVRAADEAQVWSQSYDREISDVIAVQENVARAVAERIELTLPAFDGPPAHRRSRPDGEVYDAYLRGRHLLTRRTADAVARGHEYLRDAVRRDPHFAPAHAGLAESFILLASYRALSPPAAVAGATTAARRSLELDPDLADGHAALGVLECNYEWRWQEAERAFRRALDLNPSSVNTRIKYAECLSYLGRHDRAVAEARAALELDPVSLIANAHVGLMLYRARRFEDAMRHMQRTIELDPNYAVAYLNLGLVYAAMARPDDALVAFERGRALDGASSDLAGLLGFALARAGQTQRAREIRDQLARRSATEFVQPYTIALVEIGLGEPTKAIEWLERGLEERSWLTALVNVAPELDPLRGHPRFEALVARLDFPH